MRDRFLGLSSPGESDPKIILGTGVVGFEIYCQLRLHNRFVWPVLVQKRAGKPFVRQIIVVSSGESVVPKRLAVPPE